MKQRKRIDYSGLNLRTVTKPEYAHLLLMGGWVFYLAFFYITERVIKPERFHEIHCALDDIIPFNEYFLIFYVSWYLLVGGAVIFYLLYDRHIFKHLQIFLIVTQIIGIITYIVYPSIQNLRPETFPRDNILTRATAYLYSIDTNTGVFPSMHVAFAVAVLSAAIRDKYLTGLQKWLIAVWVILISVSVCFVKQHSALDVISALVVCALAEIVARKLVSKWMQFGSIRF